MLIYRYKKALISFTFLLFFHFFTAILCFAAVKSATHAQIPYGVILPELKSAAFGDKEVFKYDISYTGGVKLGEAVIRKIRTGPDTFLVKVQIGTEGSFMHHIYPVDDRFEITMKGDDMLPVLLESWQKEGRDYKAHKVMEYDQENGIFTYKREKKKDKVYEVEGKTHNEFSSFLVSRIMPFKKGEPFIVPTFADKKKVEVVVRVGDEQKLKKTLFGDVETIKVMPIMNFKGLYDKEGDTTVWYTHDECRIPVKVNSKLTIGSLSAKLVRYTNGDCELYPDVHKKWKKSIAQKKQEKELQNREKE